MNVRDVTALLGSVVIVAIVTVVIADQRLPGTVSALGNVFITGLEAMTGQTLKKM